MTRRKGPSKAQNKAQATNFALFQLAGIRVNVLKMQKDKILPDIYARCLIREIDDSTQAIKLER